MTACDITKGLLCMLSAALIAGCADSKEPPKAKPPVPVVAAAAAVKTVPLQLKGVGTVEAYETVSVRSQVSGPIVSVHFREGEEVRKGDLLFTIDSRQYRAELKRAEANLARNQVQTKNAEQDFARYQQLFREGIVTQEQTEGYRTRAEAGSADVAADRASVENARVQLSYCTIRSPISGRTGNLSLHAGNIVKANDSTMVTINRISPVYVTFSLPEKELNRIRKKITGGGLKVEAYPEEGGAPESGVVSFLDNSVDPATGTIRLKGTFRNESRRLWPGQFATVLLTMDTIRDAVTVPTAALQTGQQGQYVFIARADGTAEMRQVTAGIAYGADTVIEKGISPGESVVTEGQMRIFPGARLAPAKLEASRGASASPAVRP